MTTQPTEFPIMFGLLHAFARRCDGPEDAAAGKARFRIAAASVLLALWRRTAATVLLSLGACGVVATCGGKARAAALAGGAASLCVGLALRRRRRLCVGSRDSLASRLAAARAAIGRNDAVGLAALLASAPGLATARSHDGCCHGANAPGLATAPPDGDNRGATLLHVAAAGGHDVCVHCLLAHGAAHEASATLPHARSRDARVAATPGDWAATPADWAARHGRPATAALLTAYARAAKCLEGGEAPYDRARRTCAELQTRPRAEQLLARVDAAAAARFGCSLDVPAVRRFGASLASDANATALPAACAGLLGAEREAGAIVFMHALDFGGGWRRALHAHHGKGAWATVKPGVEAILAEQPDLPAAWLLQLTPQRTAALFGLDASVELTPFAAALAMVCAEIGCGLTARGHATLASFLFATLARHAASPAPAAALVRELVLAFPRTFADVHELPGVSERGAGPAAAPQRVAPGASEGGPPPPCCVCFFKKAQLVAGELYHRFRHEDARFAFADGDRLTAFVDNVICAVLRKEGVVVLREAVARAIDAGELLPSGSLEEVSLRAAAMTGVELAAAAASTAAAPLTPVELGNWLWGGLGKSASHRPFPRHATGDTVFY